MCAYNTWHSSATEHGKTLFNSLKAITVTKSSSSYIRVESTLKLTKSSSSYIRVESTLKLIRIYIILANLASHLLFLLNALFPKLFDEHHCHAYKHSAVLSSILSLAFCEFAILKPMA